MIIFTLGGKSINKYACDAILFSFIEGLSRLDRIVRNKDFGTLGVGSGYLERNFGRVSFNRVAVETEITDGVNMRSIKSSFYYTHPELWKVSNPFIGLVKGTETQIYFQFPELRSAEHVTYVLEAGGRKKLRDYSDENHNLGKHKLGFLQFSLGIHFNKNFEGVSGMVRYTFQ